MLISNSIKCSTFFRSSFIGRKIISFTRMPSNSDTEPKRARSDILTIGTHSGTFHCDEVLACFMLRQLPEYKNSRIFRSRNDEELVAQSSIIVDVGGEYDHAQLRYDHHQKTFKETLSSVRPELGDGFNKIRLSSAGLIYAHYGERVINSILQRERNIELSAQNLQLTFVQIYRNFISEIDAIDNGVPMFEGVGEPLYKISTHISSRIGKLNPSWEEEGQDIDLTARFEQAMTAVGQEFVANVLEIGGSWVKAREYVREALQGAKAVYESGEILVLERFCPWKAHLSDLEKEYNVEGIPKLVIFSENKNSWRVAGVPLKPDSFLGRKFLPELWRGLRDEELSQLAGIPNCVFVHHTGFIGGAKTKEAALAMAIKSVQWPNN